MQSRRRRSGQKKPRRKADSFVTKKGKDGSKRIVPIFKPESQEKRRVLRQVVGQKKARGPTYRPPDAKTLQTARITEIVRFIGGYLTGKDVNVVYHGSNQSFAATEGKERVDGKAVVRPTILIPDWKGYKLPLNEVDTWRIYRASVTHEDLHIKFTPTELFIAKPAQVDGLSLRVMRDIMNIVEDRRIEDLGCERFKGYGPEYLFSRAYCSAFRPEVDGLHTPEEQILEAFLQVMLGGGNWKGNLDPAYADNVRRAEAFALDALMKIGENYANPKDAAVANEMTLLTEEVARLLQLGAPPQPQNSPPQNQTQGSGGQEDQQDTEKRRDQERSRDPYDEDEEDEALAGIEEHDTETGGAINPDANKEVDLVPWDHPKQSQELPQDIIDKMKPEIEKKVREHLKKGKEDAESSDDSSPFSQEDYENAESGTQDSQQEWNTIKKGGGRDEAPELSSFMPVVEFAGTEAYKNPKFRKEMDRNLKKWRTGHNLEPGKTGQILSVDQLVRTAGKKPFQSMRRQSVKGEKYLFVLDFSSSVAGMQDEYKTAIIETAEALNSIGGKLAVFGFGRTRIGTSYNTGFLKVKGFEGGNWSKKHSSKVAAISAGGLTPTGAVYEALERYVKRHRPKYVITLTDGSPNDHAQVQEKVKDLRKSTTMVAIGIAENDEKSVESFEYNFEYARYDEHFTVQKSELTKLPKEIVTMIAPET